jgi:hypothetical protein
VISSSGVGLFAPLNLVRLVVLGIGPGVVSLVVWSDVRVAILHWIDSLFHLGKSTIRCSWIES